MTDILVTLSRDAYAALTDSDPLSLLVGDRIYDYIPPDTQYPYIFYGDMEVEPDDTDDTEDNLVQWTLHIYSQYNGNKECYDIVDVLDNIVRRAGFESDGLVNIDRTFRDVVPDGDGKTRHGIARYRVRIEKEA